MQIARSRFDHLVKKTRMNWPDPSQKAAGAAKEGSPAGEAPAE